MNWDSNDYNKYGTMLGTSIDTANGASQASYGNPYATAAGGVLGLVAGYFTSAAEAKNREEKQKILEKAQEATGLTYDAIQQLYDNYFNTVSGQFEDMTGNPILSYKNDVVSKVKDLNSDIDSDKYVQDFGEFSDTYDKSVDDFINPYYEDVINKSNAKVQSSAAGAGLGRGTGAAQAIAENTAKEYNGLYDTALNQYNTDRQQAYKEYSDYITNMQTKLNTMLAQKQSSINNIKGIADEYNDLNTSMVDSRANLIQNRMNTELGLAQAYANI